MCMERTSARPSASAISNRVELLPQSKAATTSTTDVFELIRPELQIGSDEFAHGIAGADEKVGEMSVQTFDSHARAPHSPRGLHEVVTHGGVAATSRVVVVRTLEFVCVDQFFESVDASIALEAADGVVQLRIDEPEKRGHGRTVAQVRFILNDDRATVATAHDDGEAPGERSTNQRFHEYLIIVRGVVKGQRQNSSVRSKRETNPLEDLCVADVLVDDVSVFGAADDGETSG